ncbi:MAG: hypothetical protein HFI29_11115 [Lachnospiraceae bacterium]|jgi:hypothetical protein|nr:hypothetical protein [Lachnospiraceae bacterium]
MIRYGGVLLVFLLFIPFVLGDALYELFKNKKSFLGIWIKGFVLELATFELTYIFFSFVKYNFRVHGILYAGIMLLSTAAITIWILLEKRKLRYTGNIKSFQIDKRKLFIDCCIILLIVFTIAGVIFRWSTPVSGGKAAQSMNTIIQSNTVGQINPYTGIPYAEGQKAAKESGILVFFAFLSWISNIHPMLLIEEILPVFFTILFYALCFEIGRMMFGTEEKKVGLFVIGILFLHILGNEREWLPFYHLLNGIEFGDRILSFFLLPMFVSEILKFDFDKGWKHWVWLASLVLATLMMSKSAWFYVATIVFLTIGVYVGRKKWEC